MKKLHVKIVRENKTNQLFVSRDPEIEDHLVFLRNPIDSKVVYSVNFNGGELLLGLDNNHRINRFELNYPRKDWIIINDGYLKPNTTSEGCLEFVNINSRHNELHQPLIVQTDKLYSCIKINFGVDQGSDPSWVAISNQCLAMTANDYVSGFWINLHSDDSKID